MSTDDDPFKTDDFGKYPAYDDTKAKEERQAREEARKKWAPHYDAANVAPGYIPSGTSIMRDRDGNVIAAWEKTKVDKTAEAQMLRDAFEAFVEDIPKAPLVDSPSTTDADLLCVYPMGDPHLGMLSWAPETGDNFDIEIAEKGLLDAADWLVARAPAAETAIVANLGDFFHSDNMDARTARSGHSLDVDGRWPKILQAGVRVMCRVVERALEKHQRVVVRNEIGNHDDHSAIMLSIAMAMRYADNPRVEIDQSPAKYWYFRFGKNLIATTHGNGIKLADLGEIMSFDRREDWGETLFRHWYVGHVHHESVKERRGVVIETFRTLAARDAWHQAAGYRSGRDMRCDVWHREYGRETRHIVGIERLRAA